jgi:hypothetical protein
MSNIQGQPATAVPSARVSGNPNVLVERLGELPVSEWLPRYAALTWSGYAYSVSLATAAAITAYSGGAAGTPQIAVYNPTGSGKNLFLITANFGNAVAASAAGTVMWNIYFGPTVAPTAATNATAFNMLTQSGAGSVTKAWTNTALTASTALTNAFPIGSYYWATAAGAALVTPTLPLEIPGYLLIPPGSMFALGGNAALTSATWTGFVAWAELPV